MNCWIDIDKNSDFSIHNLPFGIFSVNNGEKRLGIAIGDLIVDLSQLADLGIFKSINFDYQILKSDFLNDFISLGKKTTTKVRELVQSEICNDKSILKNNSQVFIKKSNAKMHLPVKIGDYTDFYSSMFYA